MFGPDAFKGLFETLTAFAIIGFIAVIAGGAYGLYWLWNHVEIVVK